MEEERMSDSCHIYNKLRFVLRSQNFWIRKVCTTFFFCSCFEVFYLLCHALNVHRATRRVMVAMAAIENVVFFPALPNFCSTWFTSVKCVRVLIYPTICFVFSHFIFTVGEFFFLPFIQPWQGQNVCCAVCTISHIWRCYLLVRSQWHTVCLMP